MTGRLLSALLTVSLAGCAERASAGPSTMVFAAASLTAPFQELARAFEEQAPDAHLDLHFAGTPQLVVQIREGAPVDVFASADEANMEDVLASGHALGAPRTFARNRLTIVTAKGNPEGVEGLADFARDDLTVVLCGPEVPAGRYARQAMENASVVPRTASDEPSVKAIVGKIALGEVDAGVVYVTDAVAAGSSVDSVPLPDEHDVIAAYSIVALDSGASRSTGEAFVAFVLSEAGQRILGAHGFAAP